MGGLLQVKARIPGRILVMDDERSVQMLLERVLTGAGHTVRVVDTGEAALAALQRQRFDLVIADKYLPGLDGMEVLRMARTQYPNLQAILITGFPTPEAREEARELGVHAFVIKPFGILDIVELCDEALERFCTNPLTAARSAAPPHAGTGR